MARVKFRARFYVILIAVIVLIGVGAYFLLFNQNEGKLEMGSMRLEYNVNAVLIRNEACFTTERYDKIIFDVGEGQQVDNGTQIAQVFKWGYQDETMLSLLNVQKEILAEQLSRIEGIVKPDLDAINTQIQQTLTNMRATTRKEGNLDMLTLEQELKDLLEQRNTLLRTDIQSDETLNALYQKEETQLNNLSSWKRDIVNNEGSGLVSFYFDGYEQVINAEKMDVLNAGLIKKILNGTGTMSNTSSENQSPLYRLIDSQHWYMAFLTDLNAPFRLVEGEEYVVVFEGYYDQPYTATAVQSVISDKQIVNVLEFHEDMGALLGVRVAKATLKKDASGIEVPLDAISVTDGVPQIQLLAANSANRVAIDVLCVNDTHAIIRSKEGAEALAAGQRYQK